MHRARRRSWLYPAEGFQALKSYPAPHAQPSHVLSPPPQPRAGRDPPCPEPRHPCPPAPRVQHPRWARPVPPGRGAQGPLGCRHPTPLPIPDQLGSLLMEHGVKEHFGGFFFIFSFLRGFMLLKAWGPAAPLPQLPSTQALKGAGLAALGHPKSIGLMWPPLGWCLLMSPRPRTAMRGCGAGRRCSPLG